MVYPYAARGGIRIEKRHDFPIQAAQKLKKKYTPTLEFSSSRIGLDRATVLPGAGRDTPQTPSDPLKNPCALEEVKRGPCISQ